MADKIFNTAKDLSRLKLTTVEGANAYASLRETVMSEGILNRSYRYYAIIVTVSLLGFFTSLVNIYIHTNFAILFFWSLVLVIFTVQLGGLMHDAGHRCIFKSNRGNDIVGHIACALLAVRFRNWRPKHNTHHAHTNQEDEDPDVPLPLAFTDDRYKGEKGLHGFIRKYQVYLYILYGTVVAFTFRMGELRKFVTNLKFSNLGEFVVVFLGLFIWFGLPFFIFDISKALFLFFTIHPLLGLYLMNIFAPNHKGMTQFGKGVKVSFLEQQILASRNIKPGIITDYLFLGLNYQIEHHLFPNCPRNKLGKITPHVLALCKKYNLEYTSVGVVHSNKIILSQLHAVSMSDKKEAKRLRESQQKNRLAKSPVNDIPSY